MELNSLIQEMKGLHQHISTILSEMKNLLGFYIDKLEYLEVEKIKDLESKGIRISN